MKGKLTVDVQTPSQLLGDTWTFEVRDARMRRVGSIGRGGALEVDPGLYRVSTVLEDGSEHEELVGVSAGETSVARFAAGSASADTSEPSAESADSAGSVLEGLDLLQLSDWNADVSSRRGSPLFQLASAASQRRLIRRPEHQATVTADSDLRIESIGARRWRVYAAQEGAHTARVDIDPRAWRLSLPTAEPGGPRPSVELDLYLEGKEWRPRARIAAWRTVASSLQSLLGERQMERAFAVADRAAMLLAEKYQDTVGAILGALLLQRMQRLASYRSWLDHLAQRFPYWPDAAILGAVLDGESEQSEVRDRGLAALLEASTQRPCFTESYSLLLDHLRRWPDAARAEERSRALYALTERYGEVDWDALTFTHSE
ncbi:MAG: hypothetical protein U1F26_13365 [Lysobacterales bacterium]